MRLIDADKFEVISFVQESEDFTKGVEFMVDKVDNAPTIFEIPDNATNGDMIKAVFPETIIYDDIYVMHIGIGRTDMNFRKDWWNAPYKKGESE